MTASSSGANWKRFVDADLEVARNQARGRVAMD